MFCRIFKPYILQMDGMGSTPLWSRKITLIGLESISQYRDCLSRTMPHLSSHLSCSSQVGSRIVLRIGIGVPVYGSAGLARAAISGEPRRRRLCMERAASKGTLSFQQRKAL